MKAKVLLVFLITVFLLLAAWIIAAQDAAAATAHKARIDVHLQEQSNGDYRLYLFATDRKLVCEEKTIRIVQQGDAVNPLIIECSHAK